MELCKVKKVIYIIDNKISVCQKNVPYTLRSTFLQHFINPVRCQNNRNMV